MIQDWKMELYWRLPIFLQEIALSAYGCYLDRIYYGRGYEEWRQKIMEMQKWSAAETKVWQAQKLQALVELAVAKVPYYREKWSGSPWKKFHSTQDLSVLPLVDKQAIQQNERYFVADGLETKNLWSQKTSGTTGTSLQIFWPMAMVPKWWAVVEVSVRNVAGVEKNLPRAMMGGRPIVPGNTSRPPFWRYNKWWKQLYLSSYHVSSKTAPFYARALGSYGSQWLTGYGSAIAALAESANEAGIGTLPFRAVIVSGDTLLPGMRSTIEDFFDCKCLDHYGQSEGVCMAMECREGRLHIIPWIGILEILREDGTPCDPGEVGEMVGTSLLNDAMPLIRYRLGDYAAWAVDQTCSCGNPHPIISKLEGRVDDYLITKDGRKIGRLSTAMKRSPSIHSAQIVQDRPGHAYLLVRPGNRYETADSEAVREDILNRIGNFELEIVEVHEIPKTLQGKTPLVVRLDERPNLKRSYKNVLNKRELSFN